MKSFLFAMLAATIAVGPIAATAAEAQPGQRQTTIVRDRPNGRTVITQRTTSAPQRARARAWRKGERFDRRYAQNYQEVDYRRYRGLRAPPRGYRYVRSGNDAVLVGVTTGIIAAVIAGAIR